MDAETSLDYNSVKKVLMERFKLTEEGFRQNFRNSRPERGETPSQFIIKISSHLNKWFEMAVVNTLEKAIDLLIREQFVKICPGNLTMYLKERECSDIDKMTHWAEMFVEAHGLHTFHSNFKSEYIPFGKSGHNHEVDPKPSLSQDDRYSKTFQANTANRNKCYCFICKSPNHIASECPSKKKKPYNNGQTPKQIASMETIHTSQNLLTWEITYPAVNVLVHILKSWKYPV